MGNISWRRPKTPAAVIIRIIPLDVWDDFQEGNGWHVYGPGLDEFEDIIWAIPVVDVLGWIFCLKWL